MAITNQTLKELVEKVSTQNGRIGKLENLKFSVIGGGAIIVFIIDFITKVNK